MRRFLVYLIFFSTLIILCFTRMPPTYSDFYARHKLWPMAQIFGNLSKPNLFTNSTHDQEYLNQCFNSSRFYKGVVLPCDMLGNNTNITCSGALAVSHDEEAIILAFRGTNTREESDQENYFVNITVSFPGGGTVSKFWYNAFLVTWNGGLRDAFLSSKNAYANYELWVTGWSMGGSMAANAAGYISAIGLMKPSDVKLVTFGQPRIGLPDFASRYSSLVPYAYRVIHRTDYIPHTPAYAGYEHFPTEVWYNNSMLEGEPYIVCNGGEDPNCSISLFQGYNLTYPVAYSCHIQAVNEYCDHWHFNLTGYCMQGRNLTFTKLLGIA